MPCLTCVLLSNHSGFSSIYDENPADVMRYNDLCALTNPVHTDGCGSPREGLLPESGIHVGAALAGSRTFTEDGTLTGGRRNPYRGGFAESGTFAGGRGAYREQFPRRDKILAGAASSSNNNPLFFFCCALHLLWRRSRREETPRRVWVLAGGLNSRRLAEVSSPRRDFRRGAES